MISIENGEQCPYCNLVMKDSLIGGEGILTHMDQNHKEKMLDVLFPEKPKSDNEYTDSKDVEGFIAIPALIFFSLIILMAFIASLASA